MSGHLALGPSRIVLAASVAGWSLCGLAGSSGAETQAWSIVPGRSEVRIHVGKSGLFSFAGHTHEVLAPAFSGQVLWDPAQLARAEIRLEFDASALKVTGKGEPAADVPEVQRTMLGEKVLDTQRYPKIVFSSQRVDVQSRSGDRAQLRVAGNLTLHGVTRQITVPVDVTLGAGRLTATGEATIRQTDFGIEPVAAGLGTVKVKDELSLRFTFAAEPGSP